MRLFYCLIIFLCPLFNTAQTIAVKTLAIGDKVPNIVFSTVLNAPYKTTTLAAYFDKLVLLDFWATWCGSCVKEFPKLDSLQAKYQGLLQVLLVNNPGSGDDAGKIKTFLQKKSMPSGLPMRVPIVLNEKKLANLFPHLTIPHSVWIFKGRVFAITEAADVTEAHIEAVLSGRAVFMETKQELADFDRNAALLENNNGGTTASILYKSMFSSYLKGAGAAIGQVKLADSVTRRKFYINKPLLNLYNYAYPGIPTNRVILDSGLLAEVLCDTQNLAWRKQHYFCYEQTLPWAVTPGYQQRFMQADLDRAFGVSSRIEKRKLQCYVLRVTDSILLKNSSTAAAGNGIRVTDSGYLLLKNVPLGQLIKELNRQMYGKPFYPVILDETGYVAPVDFMIRLTDIHELNKLSKLLPYVGLELTTAERWVDMLVISKINVHQIN